MAHKGIESPSVPKRHGRIQPREDDYKMIVPEKAAPIPSTSSDEGEKPVEIRTNAVAILPQSCGSVAKTASDKAVDMDSGREQEVECVCVSEVAHGVSPLFDPRIKGCLEYPICLDGHVTRALLDHGSSRSFVDALVV